MSESELLDYLRSYRSQGCARLRKDQVRHYDLAERRVAASKFRTWKAAAAGLILLLLTRQSQAQEAVTRPQAAVTLSQRSETRSAAKDRDIRISGRVVDETGQPMPGVNVLLKDSESGVVSDLEGRFTFPVPVHKGQTLLFSFIGYVSKEFTIKGVTSDNIDIHLVLDEMYVLGELSVDQPYVVSKRPSIWTRLTSWF